MLKYNKFINYVMKIIYLLIIIIFIVSCAVVKNGSGRLSRSNNNIDNSIPPEHFYNIMEHNNNITNPFIIPPEIESSLNSPPSYNESLNNIHNDIILDPPPPYTH